MLGIVELQITIIPIVIGLVRTLLPAVAAQPVYAGNPVLIPADILSAFRARPPVLGVRGLQLADMIGLVRALLPAVAAQAVYTGNPVRSLV